MELIYLVSDGSLLLKMDEIFAKPAQQFLFVAEYMVRKRKIEYDEQMASITRSKNTNRY